MNQCKEAERFDSALRWIVKKLRLALDAADEHVHSWEVLLRKDSMPAASAAPGKVGHAIDPHSERGRKLQIVAQPRSTVGNRARHGSRRRRGITAREFDLRFSR